MCYFHVGHAACTVALGNVNPVSCNCRKLVPGWGKSLPRKMWGIENFQVLKVLDNQNQVEILLSILWNSGFVLPWSPHWILDLPIQMLMWSLYLNVWWFLSLTQPKQNSNSLSLPHFCFTPCLTKWHHKPLDCSNQNCRNHT